MKTILKNGVKTMTSVLLTGVILFQVFTNITCEDVYMFRGEVIKVIPFHAEVLFAVR